MINIKHSKKPFTITPYCLTEMEKPFNEEDKLKLTECEFKSKIKSKLRDHMLKELQDEQKRHPKIRQIKIRKKWRNN